MNRATIAVRNYGVQIAALVATIVVLVSTVPSFRGSSAVFASLDGLTLIGITAAGVSVTMIAGELDLSIGSMATFAGVLAVHFGSLGLVPSIVLATTVGTGLGLLQGFLIARLRISSLVFTIGSLIVISGAAWVFAGGQPIELLNLQETNPLLVRLGVFSPGSLVALVVIIGLGIFLSRTRWGREIYAIGGARAEATAAGVPVGRSLVISFGISAGFASLAGTLICMEGGSANPAGFSSLLLTAVAASLIGGISLYGGRGNMFNVLLGALILTVLAAGMATAGQQTFLTDLITGVLLIVVVSVQHVISRVRSTRKLRRNWIRAGDEDSGNVPLPQASRTEVS